MLFCTVEGIDGVGKSTQVALLYENLRKEGMNVVTTHEPGGTPFAEKIRDWLKSDSNLTLAQQFSLFDAARKDHIINFIRPSLKKGYHVISDRFIDSSYVYQNKVKDASTWEQYYYEIEHLYGGLPDITFFLNCNIVTASSRLKKRNEKPDHFEEIDLDVWYERRTLYGRILDISPRRQCFEIDASKNEEEVSYVILRLFKEVYEQTLR